MLKRIIEIIWPRLEGDPPVYDNFLSEEAEISIDNSEISIEFAKLMYEHQNDRNARIESKSSIYLGFFGTVIAILAFALKDIVFLINKGPIHDLSLVVGAILVIYILQVMRFSIQALERREYKCLNEDDFLNVNKKKTAIHIINKVKGNYDVINAKVDCMTMAHEFTKRILGILFVVSTLLAISVLYKYMVMIPDYTLTIPSTWL